MHSRTWLATLVLGAAGGVASVNGVHTAELDESRVKKRWVVADFDPVIAVGLEGYRDFENGRRRFAEATCVKCHRFAGSGPVGASAPDLAKAAIGRSPRELLESMIAPDEAIAPDEVVGIFELAGGRVVEGRVVEESETHYLINQDPRTPGRLVKVLASEIVNLRISPASAMPSGLLDQFDEDDVLDLLAYLLSGGDEDDPLFSR